MNQYPHNTAEPQTPAKKNTLPIILGSVGLVLGLLGVIFGLGVIF